MVIHRSGKLERSGRARVARRPASGHINLEHSSRRCWPRQALGNEGKKLERNRSAPFCPEFNLLHLTRVFGSSVWKRRFVSGAGHHFPGELICLLSRVRWRPINPIGVSLIGFLYFYPQNPPCRTGGSPQLSHWQHPLSFWQDPYRHDGFRPGSGPRTVSRRDYPCVADL